MSDQPQVGKSRKQCILDGIKSQTEPAEWNGDKGFWVQADCAFIVASAPAYAIEAYRDDVQRYNIACSHNRHCSALQKHDDPQQAEEIRRLKAERDSLKDALTAIATQFNAWPFYQQPIGLDDTIPEGTSREEWYALWLARGIAEALDIYEQKNKGLKETLREICEWALALTDDPQLQSNANIGQLRVLCEGQLRRLDKEE